MSRPRVARVGLWVTLVGGLVAATEVGCQPRGRRGVVADGRPPEAPTATIAATSSVPAASASASTSAPVALVTTGPGFPESGPWLSFYGTAQEMGSLDKVAQAFRIINLDADPADDGVGNFTDAQIHKLRAAGKNRVLSYLNVGACERYRTYWKKVPAGFVSCGANVAAQLGSYEGYSDEVWMDPSSPDYQKLIVEHVAARLLARGVDGLYLDNLELLSHAPTDKNGPCSKSCRQGGLDLVRKLRERYPDALLVMQNGTSDVTRLGTTGGVRFATLLDGIAHEEVWEPKHDPTAEAELLAWKALGLGTKAGRPFWIAVEDYVGGCSEHTRAHAVFQKALSHGFAPCVTDDSGKQKVVCYWAP